MPKGDNARKRPLKDYAQGRNEFLGNHYDPYSGESMKSKWVDDEHAFQFNPGGKRYGMVRWVGRRYMFDGQRLRRRGDNLEVPFHPNFLEDKLTDTPIILPHKDPFYLAPTRIAALVKRQKREAELAEKKAARELRKQTKLAELAAKKLKRKKSFDPTAIVDGTQAAPEAPAEGGHMDIQPLLPEFEPMPQSEPDLTVEQETQEEEAPVHEIELPEPDEPYLGDVVEVDLTRLPGEDLDDPVE